MPQQDHRKNQDHHLLGLISEVLDMARIEKWKNNTKLWRISIYPGLVDNAPIHLQRAGA